MGNHILTINTYFNMLRINSHINQFTDMWHEYQSCIAIICDDFLPRKKKLELKPNIDHIAFRGKDQDIRGVNFDPITIEEQPEDVLINLIRSVKNLRRDIAVNEGSKRIMAIAAEIERTSFLTELEVRFVLALNYPVYQIGEDQPYFDIMMEFLLKFFDKFDVVSDLKKYIQLLSTNEAAIMRAKAREKLDAAEAAYDEEGEEPPSMTLIRWRIVHFKLNKVLGSFQHLENGDKLKLVNTIMQTYLWAHGSADQLTDNDRLNLDDMIIVAAELLYEINIYEWSVLNPINYMMISMLELAVSRSQARTYESSQANTKPQDMDQMGKNMQSATNTLRIWLMRVLGKLGLSSRFTGVSTAVKGLVEENFEKFGALKYSHYQAFGTERELLATCERYEKYYSEALTKNKNALVSGFKDRNFTNLNDLLSKNEHLENSFFQQVVMMSKLHLEIVRTSTSPSTIQKTLNKNSQFLQNLTEEDKIPVISKINPETREFGVIKLGLPREKIKEEICIEAVYDKKAAKKKKERDAEIERK